MATTLPTVDDVIGGVRAQSLPRVNVSRDALGGAAIDKGAQQLAGSIKSATDEYVENVSTTEAQELTNELNKTRREMLDGTADTEGYTSLNGEEALRARENLEQEWETKRQEIMSRASSGIVSRKLANTAARQNELFLSGVSSHANTAQKQKDENVFLQAGTEQTENSISAARITDFNDKNAVKEYNAGINAYRSKAFLYYRKKTGVGDQARALAEKDVAEVHKQVIEDMMINQPARARAYFERYADQIPSKLHDDIIKPVKVAADLQEATDFVAEAKTMHGGLTTAAERNEADKLAVTRYAKDAKKLKAARAALKAETDRMDNLKKDGDDELRETARGKIAEARLAGKVFNISKLSTKEYIALTKTQSGVRLLENAVSKPGLVPADTSRTNFGGFADQFTKMAEGTLPVLTGTQFEAQYAGKLDEGDYKRANRMLINLRNTQRRDVDAGKRRAAQEGINDTARIKTALSNNGLLKYSGQSLNKASKTRLGNFTKLVDDKWRDAARLKGDALTTDEKTAVIDNLLMKQVYVDTFGSDTRRIGPLVTDDVANNNRVYVPYRDLTDADKTVLQNLLVQNGVPRPANQADTVRLIEDFAGAVNRGPVYQQRFIAKNSSPQDPGSE